MNPKILVIGAGPVGLASALFCHRSGHSVQIVDQLPQPVLQSKALAVNPRSLEILEPFGITAAMLELGLKIRGAVIWKKNGMKVGEFQFPGLHPKYPFMLALSQAVTERLLTETLKKEGVEIERNRRVISCQNQKDETTTYFEDRSEVASRFVYAADGAHSVIRKGLNLSFEGSTFPGDWYLADVWMKTDLAEDRAHVIFNDGPGFYFLIRVVTDQKREQGQAKLWRIMSSMPDPLKAFDRGEIVEKPVWESNFHVSHRIVDHFNVGSIFLGGDAAHLHSPAGARGMNLGIEDAFVFSKLLSADRLDQYDRFRRSVDQKVVKRVDLISRVAMGDQAFIRWIRNLVIPRMLKIEAVQHLMFRTMTGLDHEI